MFFCNRTIDDARERGKNRIARCTSRSIIYQGEMFFIIEKKRESEREKEKKRRKQPNYM